MNKGDKIKVVAGPLKGQKGAVIGRADKTSINARLTDGRTVRLDDRDYALELSTGTKILYLGGVVAMGIVTICVWIDSRRR